MPRSPAKSLTSTAASPPDTSLDPPRDAEEVGHGVMGPGRPANCSCRTSSRPVCGARPVASRAWTGKTSAQRLRHVEPC